MSQENVEIIRRSLDAYCRRDVDTLRMLNHPGLELDWSASRGSLAGVYRGFDEALRFYAEYYEVFETTVVEPDRFVETGDLVVVPNVVHQRGRDGVECLRAQHDRFRGSQPADHPHMSLSTRG